jgi:hypothetical protein
VALGIVFRPESLRNSSFSELLFPVSIFATSLADAAPQRGTRCADRYDAEAPSGQVRRIEINDKWIFGYSKNDECQMSNDEESPNAQNGECRWQAIVISNVVIPLTFVIHASSLIESRIEKRICLI